MTRKDSHHFIFPDETAIPSDLEVGLPLEQKTYLVDGEIRVWSGPVHDVQRGPDTFPF